VEQIFAYREKALLDYFNKIWCSNP
jgi:hypothetical protein